MTAGSSWPSLTCQLNFSYHHLNSSVSPFPKSPQKHYLTLIFLVDLKQRGNISLILQTRKSWEQDLGLNIEDDQWGQILISLQLLHLFLAWADPNSDREFITLNTYGLKYTPVLVMPVTDVANPDLVHMFWSCPKLTHFKWLTFLW